MLKGGRVDDLFLYDEDGGLLQRGVGGELRRAKRLGNTFEWTNVGQNRLDYVLAYDTLGRTCYFKTMGHFFGPGLAYQLEEYDWRGDQLVGQRIIRNYKKGQADTTLVEFIYDDQGLLSRGRTKKSDESSWLVYEYTTDVQFEQSDRVRISIAYKDQAALAVTFDEYDNWVEIARPSITLRRQISYRKRPRRR